MTKDQKKKCNAIIHGASIAAGGVGAGTAKIPLADNAILVPLQTAMIVSLGSVFGHTLADGAVKAAVGTALATQLGQAAFKTLIGFIPVAGEVIRAGVAVSFTEALGWAVAHEFDEHKEELIDGNLLKQILESALVKITKK